MRRSPAFTPFAIAALVAAAMSGCLPSDPAPVPTLEPTAVPLFASDEEALAAAEETYGKYVAVSDLVAQEGGANPERLADYVTDEWLTKEVEAFEEIAASGVRQIGSTSVSNATLQQVLTDAVVFYVCSDSSGTVFVNAAGTDVTPVDRQTLYKLEVTVTGSDGSELRIEGIEPWPDASGC